MNSKSRVRTKLKIPPAFEPDVWICNHSCKKNVENKLINGSIVNAHSIKFNEKILEKKSKILSMRDYEKLMDRKYELQRLARRKKLQSPYSKKKLLSEYSISKNLALKKHNLKKFNKKLSKLKMFCKGKYGHKFFFKKIKRMGQKTKVKVNYFSSMRRKFKRRNISFIKSTKNTSNYKNLKNLDENYSLLNESIQTASFDMPQDQER